VICDVCGSDRVRKKGKRRGSKIQRYYCRDCERWFQKDIELGIKKEIKRPVYNWRDYSKVAQDHQQLKDDAQASQVEANVSIGESDIVLFLGCLHFGARGTDYGFLERLTNFIKENRIKFIMAGDDVDMFFSNFYSAMAIHEQVLSPQEQLYFLESWLDEVGDLLLASCWGNHELRIQNLTGLHIYDNLKARFAPFFGGIGRLNLKVGSQLYRIILSHSGKGFSIFNPLHGLFNLARRYVDGDLFVGAHFHEAAIGTWQIREKYVTAVQTGTLKVNDDYAQRYFNFGKSQPFFPCVWFSDKEPLLVPFLDIFQGIEYRRLKR